MMHTFSEESRSKHLDPLGGSHGSAWPYVIGFVLSLILTLVPYYFVSHGVTFKVSLLIVILVFASLQLLVQGIFFLHIGRGPTPLYNLFFLVSTLGIVLLVVVASIWIMNHLNYNMMPTDMSTYIIQQEGIDGLNGMDTSVCKIVPHNFQVEVMNDQAYPSLLQATRCDSLTLLNKDSGSHTFSLQKVNEPQMKSNYHEIDVRGHGNESISLYQTGDYMLVDKNTQAVRMHITIAPVAK